MIDFPDFVIRRPLELLTLHACAQMRKKDLEIPERFVDCKDVPLKVLNGRAFIDQSLRQVNEDQPEYEAIHKAEGRVLSCEQLSISLYSRTFFS